MTGFRERLSIEFDDIIYSLQSHGGITQYWQELTMGISKRDDCLVSHRRPPAWQRFFRPNSAATIFHSSFLRVARGARVRNVITVHDMAYELGHLGGSISSRLGVLERRRAYFAADALICVSHSTRRDLLQLYPALQSRCAIHVIHHGPTVAENDPGLPLPEVFASLETPFVLFVGGRKHYKNFDAALTAFSESGLSRLGFKLVCTGASFSELEARQITARGISGSVISVGTTSRAGLVSLYRHAYGLLYPSRFEGFGMPVIEAMTLGCPVIAANATSIPEIAGDAALLVDPLDIDAIAAALLSLQKPDLRARLIAAGRRRALAFSWARSIGAHASVYAELAALPSTARPHVG